MRIISDAGVFAATGSPVYTTHMASSQLSVGTYSIPRGGVDDQSPHAEDEIYVVTSGQAGFEGPWGRVSVGPGAVLFVPAGEAHRFVDVTEDLALLVIFAPPYSGEDLSSGCLGWRASGGARRAADLAGPSSRRRRPVGRIRHTVTNRLADATRPLQQCGGLPLRGEFGVVHVW